MVGCIVVESLAIEVAFGFADGRLGVHMARAPPPALMMEWGDPFKCLPYVLCIQRTLPAGRTTSGTGYLKRPRA